MTYIILFTASLLLLINAYLITVIYKYKKDGITVNEYKSKLQEIINDMEILMYFELDGSIFTNIDDTLLERAKDNIKENYSRYRNYNILGNAKQFCLEKNKESIAESNLRRQNIENEEMQTELRMMKDRSYYFYKEFVNKLTFLLKEVDELYTQYKINKGKINKYDLENLKSKLEFIIKFFKENGGVEYHRYRLYNIQELSESLNMKFSNELEIMIRTDMTDLYIEIEKVNLVIENIIYSLLKSRVVREKIKMDIVNNGEMLKFEIKAEKSGLSFDEIIDEEFMSLLNYENNAWCIEIGKNSFVLKVPVKVIKDVKETDEIKNIIIESNLTTIREVEKNILYDMGNNKFAEDEIRDMKLVIDEVVINAIEHGNEYDSNKKVKISYRFLEDGKILEMEVEDEGNGFDIEDMDLDKLEKPDIFGERGRGIYIIKNIVDDLKYTKHGRHVYVKKIRKK